jgi:S1-C subfamily serine protease
MAFRNLARLSGELSQLITQVRISTVVISGAGAGLGESSGSGWVYDNEGHVVTNHHVVDGIAGRMRVKPAGKPELTGELIGSDPSNDLAVVRVPELAARPLPIREGPAMLGELCVALGAPHGLQESASLGIVSGLARQLPQENNRPIEEVIQTDASINPGNSGGPLVDAAGYLLGVNTAIRANAQGLGFAISGEIVRDVVPELIRFGAIHRASIGVSIATQWVNVDGVDHNVVSVQRVNRADSPFEVDDVLLQVGSTPITRRYDVVRALRRDTVGRLVQVWVDRAGETVELEVRAEALTPKH